MKCAAREERYIPGFDWIKLVGFLIVARFHIIGSTAAGKDHIIAAMLHSIDVVGLFFLMSSFLLGRALSYKREPLQYLKKYVVKYFSIYYVFLLFSYIYIFAKAYLYQGYSKWLNVVFFFLTEPLMLWNASQLWFIPPLLLSGLIFGLCIIKGKKKLFHRLIWFILPGFLAVYGLRCLYDTHWLQGPLQTALGCGVKSMTYYLRGISFVWLGMRLAYWRADQLRLRYLAKYLVPLVLCTVCLFLGREHIDQRLFESVLQKYLTIGWTWVLFIGILKLKGRFLYPYHRFISVFSIGCFFDHIILNELLSYWFDSKELRFLLVLAVNVIFAALILWVKGCVTQGHRVFLLPPREKCRTKPEAWT